MVESGAASWYATYVMKCRWPEAEQYILNSTSCIFYAKDLMKCRWPEAEQYLLNEAKKFENKIVPNKMSPIDDLWCYVEFVMGHTRWPEAEEYIKFSPRCASNYARKVLKSKWPEAEEYIKKEKVFWGYYQDDIRKYI